VCAFDHNLYWNASGKPAAFGKRSLAEWQALRQDKNSLVADPLFVDPEQGDFRLRRGSPAGPDRLRALEPVGDRPAQGFDGVELKSRTQDMVRQRTFGAALGKRFASVNYS
jgi:hypothetical protein